MMEKTIDIAREAGKILMDFYRSGNLAVEIKEDLSPVTDADRASDDYIRESLKRNFKVCVVSEESEVAYEERGRWDALFMVDPLDGTKDFIAKNDEFTINIALIKNRQSVFGVVFAPALDELFYAEKGRGAFVLKDGKLSRLPMFQCDGYALARSWHHDSEEIERFARLNSITHSRTMSSAIRFPRLAQGVVSIYAGFNRSKEWDTAAGHIIAAESGCRVVDLATQAEPVYNKPDLKNNPFIACSKQIDFEKLQFAEVARDLL